MSETRFRYVAFTTSGDDAGGTVRAQSQATAVEMIRARGLTPTQVTRIAARRNAGKHIKRTEIAALTRELAVLMDAKVPLAAGLMSAADARDDDRLADVVRDVAARVEAGEAISKAFGNHPSVFGRVFVKTLRAAEVSGTLCVALEHLADMQDRQIAASQALQRALAYPAVVICFVMLALVVLLTFVIPRFAETFEATRVELPLITQIVQTIGLSMRTDWYLYAGSLLAMVWAVRAAWRSEPGRLVIERAAMRVPYIRAIIVADSVARFSRVLGIGLGAGLGVIDSFELAASASGQRSFTVESQRALSRLRAGSNLAEAIGDTSPLPGLARRMLVTGKDSAELARACRVVAQHYDRRTEHLSKSVGTIIEPILTIALSAIVLLVALSVFLPMWEMVRVNR